MLLETLQSIVNTVNRCIECKDCVPECEVLKEADFASVGEISKAYILANRKDKSSSLLGRYDATIKQIVLDTMPSAEELEVFYHHVRVLVREEPQYLFAVRRCMMCGFCTRRCPAHVDARKTFASIRAVLTEAQVVPSSDFNSTQVDTQWHIFSVYRAVYGIYYNHLAHVEHAQEIGAKSLFFPGCSLASYAPELTEEILAWLNEHYAPTVISEECCGSPLIAAGQRERNLEFKKSILSGYVASGITEVVTVCPGCEDELKELREEFPSIKFKPLPQVLLESGVKISQNRLNETFAQGIEEDSVVDSVKKDELKVSVFDSCHDRCARYGEPLRKLFDANILVEMEHQKENAICCGAAGSVSLVDPKICEIRAKRVMTEGAKGANILVSNCPTCAYTLAFYLREHGEWKEELKALSNSEFGSLQFNYLELVFENKFNWPKVFNQLETMWTGEYGEWVCQQLV